MNGDDVDPDSSVIDDRIDCALIPMSKPYSEPHEDVALLVGIDPPIE